MSQVRPPARSADPVSSPVKKYPVLGLHLKLVVQKPKLVVPVQLLDQGVCVCDRCCQGGFFCAKRHLCPEDCEADKQCGKRRKVHVFIRSMRVSPRRRLVHSQ